VALIRLDDDAEAVAFLEVVELLASLPGHIENSLSHRCKRIRIMEDSAVRVPRTPEAASKSVGIGVNDVDVNQTIGAVLLLDKVAVIASDQFNVGVRRESAHSFIEDIVLVDGVLVTMKGINTGHGCKE